MKEANNNAMDLLLRSLARGERDHSWSGADSVSQVGSDSGMGSEHLDADELNLYAEGVLAPPAKTRYTAHLADCQRCRTLVVGLAQAAGRTVQPATKKQRGSSFLASLGALFSLPVLRYAIPAILLTGMISLGLVALRNSTSSEQVALNQTAERAAPNLQSSITAEQAPTTAAPTLREKSGSDAGAAPSAAATPDRSTGLLTQQPDSSAEKGRVGGLARDVVAPEAPGVAAGRPIYAPDPAPAPAPPPKVAGESDAKSALQKEKEDYYDAVAKRNQDELKLSSKDDSPSHGPSRSRNISGGSRRDEDVTVTTENRAANVKDKKEASEETDTLSVSGRNFRRRGNAWIDTAYNSARSVTNVGRGTEQFRSLMADEPGLRAIVQRLSGEVIVVWKNRAYRIR